MFVHITRFDGTSDLQLRLERFFLAKQGFGAFSPGINQIFLKTQRIGISLGTSEVVEFCTTLVVTQVAVGLVGPGFQGHCVSKLLGKAGAMDVRLCGNKEFTVISARGMEIRIGRQAEPTFEVAFNGAIFTQKHGCIKVLVWGSESWL